MTDTSAVSASPSRTDWEAVASFATRADALLAESASLRAEAMRLLAGTGAATIVEANSVALAERAAARANGSVPGRAAKRP